MLRKLGRFDSARGKPDAFVARVLRNFLANQLRNRAALRRDPRRASNLGTADRGGRVPEAARDRFGRQPRTRLEETDLGLDVLAVVESLPAELRDLAARLMRQPVAQAARETGVARTTPQSRLRKIRSLFEQRPARLSVLPFVIPRPERVATSR